MLRAAALRSDVRRRGGEGAGGTREARRDTAQRDPQRRFNGGRTSLAGGVPVHHVHVFARDDLALAGAGPGGHRSGLLGAGDAPLVATSGVPAHRHRDVSVGHVRGRGSLLVAGRARPQPGGRPTALEKVGRTEFLLRHLQDLGRATFAAHRERGGRERRVRAGDVGAVRSGDATELRRARREDAVALAQRRVLGRIPRLDHRHLRQERRARLPERPEQPL